MSEINTTTDWAKLRAEYVNGSISLADLAKKYGVKISTLKKHSSKEKWSEERQKKRKSKADKVVDKLHDKDVNQTVKEIERCCKAAGKLIDKINKAINQVDKSYYVSLDDKTITSKETKGEYGETDIINTKVQRKIRTKQYNALIDTKRIAELSKSLLNIKQILTGTEQQGEDENTGIIEIPAMQELEPPKESEESNEP
ncbi:hypothetical protein [Ruminococcus sp.]|uniref:hypothetical protein n=1 Tax=Ruminococcus sp. TaxID=41978 RepID=UPI003EFEEA3C